MISVTHVFIAPFKPIIHHVDFHFFTVCLKSYLVRPQTKVHPDFKRGKEICSVIWSDFTVSFHSEVHNMRNVTGMVCGGKTYKVT